MGYITNNMTNIIPKSSINWDMIWLHCRKTGKNIHKLGYDNDMECNWIYNQQLKKKMWWSHLKDTGMLVNGDHHPISMVENSKKSPIT
jgi:hypothetical protein